MFIACTVYTDFQLFWRKLRFIITDLVLFKSLLFIKVNSRTCIPLLRVGNWNDFSTIKQSKIIFMLCKKCKFDAQWNPIKQGLFLTGGVQNFKQYFMTNCLGHCFCNKVGHRVLGIVKGGMSQQFSEPLHYSIQSRGMSYCPHDSLKKSNNRKHGVHN